MKRAERWGECPVINYGDWNKKMPLRFGVSYHSEVTTDSAVELIVFDPVQAGVPIAVNQE